jgi:hypothetical protein
VILREEHERLSSLLLSFTQIVFDIDSWRALYLQVKDTPPGMKTATVTGERRDRHAIS